MAGFVAKKLCPELIFVPLDFKLYVEASKTIMDVLRQYGETSPASLDEACKRNRAPFLKGSARVDSDLSPPQTSR
jgi:nucleotidyltransferase/DNA polymerase involved in DNA repair